MMMSVFAITFASETGHTIHSEIPDPRPYLAMQEDIRWFAVTVDGAALAGRFESARVAVNDD
jgi:hypothetical protein